MASGGFPNWLQDGFPGNGFRMACQEMAPGWSGLKALPKKWLQMGFPRSFKKLLQELHRKWLQEGFPGSGFRRASQEVALGGLPFSKWLQEGPRKWLQQGFPGSGFGCGVRSFPGSCFKSFPGSGFKRLPRKWAQELQEGFRKWLHEGFSGSGLRKASQEAASGSLRGFSGSCFRKASQEVGSGWLPRKWLQRLRRKWFQELQEEFRKWLHEGFPGSGLRKASQEEASGSFRASQEVASGKLPRKWAQEGFPGSGFKGFAGNGRASQEMGPGGFQKGFLMFFLTFFSKWADLNLVPCSKNVALIKWR